MVKCGRVLRAGKQEASQSQAELRPALSKLVVPSDKRMIAWTTDTKRAIDTMEAEGKSMQEIADYLYCDIKRVKGYFARKRAAEKKHKSTVPPVLPKVAREPKTPARATGYDSWTEAEVATATAMRAQGMTIANVMVELDRSYTSVRAFFTRKQVEEWSSIDAQSNKA